MTNLTYYIRTVFRFGQSLERPPFNILVGKNVDSRAAETCPDLQLAGRNMFLHPNKN